MACRRRRTSTNETPPSTRPSATIPARTIGNVEPEEPAELPDPESGCGLGVALVAWTKEAAGSVAAGDGVGPDVSVALGTTDAVESVEPIDAFALGVAVAPGANVGVGGVGVGAGVGAGASTYVLKSKSMVPAKADQDGSSSNAWPPAYSSAEVEPYTSPVAPKLKTIAYFCPVVTLMAGNNEKLYQPSAFTEADDPLARSLPNG